MSGCLHKATLADTRSYINRLCQNLPKKQAFWEVAWATPREISTSQEMVNTSSGNAASIAITLCGVTISGLGDRPCRYLVPQGFVHLAHQRVAREGFLKKETLLQILSVTVVVFKIARHVNGLHIRAEKF